MIDRKNTWWNTQQLLGGIFVLIVTVSLVRQLDLQQVKESKKPTTVRTHGQPKARKRQEYQKNTRCAWLEERKQKRRT